MSKAENLYTPNCIRTFSGKYINPLDPDPELIDIEDIAHALSNQCRFGGHTVDFFSVAQHCIFMCERITPGHELAALLHDASEAYLLDIPKPIKVNLNGYEEAEQRIMKIIASKYGFQYPLHDEVKFYDKWALEDEWENLVIRKNRTCYPPALAKSIFLELFNLHTSHQFIAQPNWHAALSS
jgi:hypothetical protein